MADHNSLMHSKVSVQPDNPSSLFIQPSDWNHQHIFNGGANGRVLTYDNSQNDNALWVSPGDLSNVLGSSWIDVNNIDGNSNAHITRIRDRLFVDDGVLGTGTFAPLNISNSRSGTAINSVQWNWGPRNASLVAINSWGQTGVTGMSVASRSGRSGDPYPGAFAGAIGVCGFALADRTDGFGYAWGMYAEALRLNASCQGATGFELDVGNAGDIIDMTAYTSSAPKATVGVGVAAGGSSSPAVTYTPSTAGIILVSNQGIFRKGIIVLNGSLDTSQGNGGNGIAVQVARGMSIQWANATPAIDSEVWGSSTGLKIRHVNGVTHTFGDTVTLGGALEVNSGVLIKSNSTLINGGAAQTATMTNSPKAGNPTKWVPINDNGTTRYIPCW